MKATEGLLEEEPAGLLFHGDAYMKTSYTNYRRGGI